MTNNDVTVEVVFPKKFAKKLPEGFMEKAESMSLDDLKKELVSSERTISSTEKDMEMDPKLNELKEEVADVAGAYKEIINAHKAMVRYLVFTLDSRGSV